MLGISVGLLPAVTAFVWKGVKKKRLSSFKSVSLFLMQWGCSRQDGLRIGEMQGFQGEVKSFIRLADTVQGKEAFGFRNQNSPFL